MFKESDFKWMVIMFGAGFMGLGVILYKTCLFISSHVEIIWK